MPYGDGNSAEGIIQGAGVPGSVGTPSEPIPAMDKWSLVILALCLTVSALWLLRSKTMGSNF